MFKSEVSARRETPLYGAATVGHAEAVENLLHCGLARDEKPIEFAQRNVSPIERPLTSRELQRHGGNCATRMSKGTFGTCREARFQVVPRLSHVDLFVRDRQSGLPEDWAEVGCRGCCNPLMRPAIALRDQRFPGGASA